MAVFEIFASNITKTSVTIGVRLDPSDAGTYRVFLSFPEGDDDTVYFGQMTPGNQQTRYSTFQGLTSGTEYIVYGYLQVSWDNGSSYNDGIRVSCTFTTESEQSVSGSITNVAASPSSDTVTISWRWSTSDTSSYYRGTVHLSTDPNFNQHMSSSTATISGSGNLSKTFSDLQEDTTYYYRIVMNGSTSSSMSPSTVVDSYTGSFTTDEQTQTQTVLLKWSWSTASGSWNAENQPGHSSLASAAYTAVQNHGATTDFSHLVWNDIIDWLCDCLDAVEYSYSSSTVTAAKMTTSDKILTAVRFNNMRSLWMDLRSAITSGSASDPRLSEVSTGDTVYGTIFVNLVYWMNAFITDYNDDNS